MSNITCHEREARLAHDPRAYLMYTARARKLQSEAIGRGLAAAVHFPARIGSNAYRWITGAIRKRQTIAKLSQLDDHVLADIGIDRVQIPMVAQGLIAPSGDAPRRTIPTAPCPPEYRSDAANDARSPSIAA